MIEKIISIKNVGTFLDYTQSSKNGWNGVFEKINIIYAPNGSGKTTLSTIINSAAKNQPDLIRLKQSINQKDHPEVKILLQAGQIVQFKDKAWNQQLENIEVFDIHFIEDFLFLSSISSEKNTTNLLKLLLGDRGVGFRNRFRNLQKKRTFLLKEQQKQKGIKKPNQNKVKTINSNLKVNAEAVNVVLEEFNNYSSQILKAYVSVTNSILSKFTNNIRLHSLINPAPLLDAEKFNLSLNIEVKGKLLRFKLPDLSKKIGNAKFTLSEGDKNAIALSFFLARLEVMGKADKIVFIDDPLSSFDHHRKTSTINLLASLASECKQLFLLTHDIYFAKSFKEKLSFTRTINLKIDHTERSNLLSIHDIDFDTSSGYKKDIRTIKDFETKVIKSEADKREVVRCIRPILETLLKAKFFEYLQENDWLGDIISKIRNSPSGEPLSNLKTILPDLINLNDFSKVFYHSENTTNLIDDNELNFNLQLLRKTIVLI